MFYKLLNDKKVLIKSLSIEIVDWKHKEYNSQRIINIRNSKINKN